MSLVMDHTVLAARLHSLGQSVRETADDAVSLARLTRDLPGFLHRPVHLDEARDRLRQRRATREQRLLTVVANSIYGHKGSPYLRLLRHAGCELGDFRSLVAHEGIEGALTLLADRGVYVTFDEQKGRCDIVRGSLRFSVRATDFDNPVVRPHIILHTSGSGGRPGRVRYSMALIEEWATSVAMVLEAHGVYGIREAYWWPVVLYWFLASATLGYPILAWFYPVHPLPVVVRMAARHLALVARLCGRRFPLPQRCDLETPEQMVGWLADQLRTGGPLILRTMPSAAARLGVTAAEAGVDLRGLTLVVAGEPVTEARRRQIEASGARTIVLYSSIELLGLSYSCATPMSSDDVHVMIDRYTLVQRQRPTVADGPIVDSMLFTSLSPQAGKIAFNMELGDYARVEERDCGCLLGERGLRTHLSEIRSFEKLTGEGVTFARSSLEQILEEHLPARFGGTGLDYQLAEEGAPNGATRLVLRVSPTIGDVDVALLQTTLLEELGRGGVGNRYQADLWRAAGTVEVRREAPLATRAGKVLPFQLLKPSGRSSR